MLECRFQAGGLGWGPRFFFCNTLLDDLMLLVRGLHFEERGRPRPVGAGSSNDVLFSVNTQTAVKYLTQRLASSQPVTVAAALAV